MSSNHYEDLTLALLAEAAQDGRAQPWMKSVDLRATAPAEEWVQITCAAVTNVTHEGASVDARKQAFPTGYVDARKQAFPTGHIDVRTNAFPAGHIDIRSHAFPTGQVDVRTNVFPAGNVNVLTNAFPA